MIKILVADSVVEFCTVAAEAFEDRYAVCVCHDGRTALRMICAEKPDVIWLDLMLPGMDGLAILQAVKLAGMSPSVVACVRHVSDHLLEVLSRYKISWIMEKPVNLPSALLRLESLAAAEVAKRAEPVKSADRMIYETLQLLGLAGKKRGHRSLFSALRLMVTVRSTR